MRFKISSIFEYTVWLLKNNNALQQAKENNIYRIIEIKQSTYDQHKIIIQVIGKSTIIECSPQEIVAEDRLLEGFSKKDVRTITFLACDQIKKPKYKIIMQECCGVFNKILFKLKKFDGKEIVSKTADQISLDKNLLSSLSREDACSICYTAGYEQSSVEKFGNEI